MRVFLGFGSNHGDRHHWLREGIRAMQEAGLQLQQVSPVVESPALLPAGSPWDWNRPFLNCVASYETQSDGPVDQTITRMREHINAVQAACGRPHPSRWAPRPLDVDILLVGEEQCSVGRVTVPNPDLLTRNFVLSPLAAMCPELTIPGGPPGTILEHSRTLAHHIPLWMGVLNITPDSFSDGGKHERWESVKQEVQRMREHGVHLLDLGAESTRPGATPLDAEQEWARLAPILLPLIEFLGDDPLRPQISIDTYHAQVAERAIEAGVRVINDVSGLEAPGMLALAAAHPEVTLIAMHNLGVPADRAVTLPGDADPYLVVRDWILRKLELWSKAGLGPERTVIDPGIGFGKDALQSLHLLRSAGELGRLGVRLLIGHSRKSFMKSFSEGPLDSAERDLITTGASLNLCQQGVDIIRVHNVPMHTAAYRGWSHLVSMPLPPAERPSS